MPGTALVRGIVTINISKFYPHGFSPYGVLRTIPISDVVPGQFASSRGKRGCNWLLAQVKAMLRKIRASPITLNFYYNSLNNF